jgi:2-polyprenyl-3-methyl-5-hydroxy-6-metoxy-1,4-benzoquinol methylase
MELERLYANQFVNWVREWFFDDDVLSGRGIGKLLDLGSGKGYHAARFRELGFKVTEIDLTTGWDLNKKRLNFKNKFDYIYCRSTIEYIKDPLQLLKDCWRALKPGGRVFFLTPNWTTQHKTFYDNWRRCSPFTEASFEMIMKDAGFTTIYTSAHDETKFFWRYTTRAFYPKDGGKYLIYYGEKNEI